MRFKVFHFALLISLGLLNWSYSIFHPEKVKKDEAGYYTDHYWSCGPRALNKAFKELDIYLSSKKISQEIQDSGNLSRALLSLVHHDAVQITFPCEMYHVIEKHGFRVVGLKELKQLNSKIDIALILVARNYLDGEAHWLCFPVDNDIKGFFGKETKIVKIFLLKLID